ncbi:MAG: LamB/YcsF family protein [Bacillota bacterium]
MPVRVDLNCDMGESFGAYTIGVDELIMPLITSANIACGFHAGDPLVMRRTVRLAREHGVAVGAHPGFRDLAGFGRRPMECSPDEVYGDVLYQIGALAAVCRAERVALNHVKPHGALYNMANADPHLARAVAAAVADFDPTLFLFALPGSALQKAGEERGLKVACEVFADRAYNPDGSLVARSRPGAVLADELAAATQARKMVQTGRVTAITGDEVEVRADTICVHGDNPHAVAFIRRIREALLAESVTLAAPGTAPDA